jgi:hypothetical protein
MSADEINTVAGSVSADLPIAEALTKGYLQPEAAESPPSPGGEGLRVRANRNIRKAPAKPSPGAADEVSVKTNLIRARVRASVDPNLNLVPPGKETLPARPLFSLLAPVKVNGLAR